MWKGGKDFYRVFIIFHAKRKKKKKKKNLTTNNLQLQVNAYPLKVDSREGEDPMA